jgi:hypothetical protein
MKQKWCAEQCSNHCTKNKRSGRAWLKNGIWKLKGIRKGFVTGICPLYLEEEEEEDAEYILLKYLETERWRETFYIQNGWV